MAANPEQLVLNAALVTLAPTKSACTNNVVGVYVLSLRPTTNFETEIFLSTAGTSEEICLPAGDPATHAFPRSLTSHLGVTNASIPSGADVLVGFFGPGPNVTYPFSLAGGTAALELYQTASVPPGGRTMVLEIIENSTDSRLFIVITGDGATRSIAVNTDPEELPPAYRCLPNLEATSSSSFQEVRDLNGKSLFVVNLSLTPGGSSQVRIFPVPLNRLVCRHRGVNFGLKEGVR